MAIEFVAFDKAVEELGISPDQLKKAISSGEVRAFSDGGTFKFRRQDLDAFKNKRQTSQTLNIPPTSQVKAPPKPAPAPAPAVPSADEIPELSLEDIEPVLEEAQAEPAAASAEAPEALPELPTEETVLEPPAPPKKGAREPAIPMPTQVTEELTLDDIPDLGATQPGTEEVSLEEIPQPEVLPLEGDLDLLTEGGGADATQPIEIQGEEASSPAYGTVSMEVPEGISEAPEDFGMMPAATGGLDVKREGSPLWAAVAAVTAAFLIFAWVVVLGISKDYPVGYLSLFSDFMYSGPS